MGSAFWNLRGGEGPDKEEIGDIHENVASQNLEKKLCEGGPLSTVQGCRELGDRMKAKDPPWALAMGNIHENPLREEVAGKLGFHRVTECRVGILLMTIIVTVDMTHNPVGVYENCFI